MKKSLGLIVVVVLLAAGAFLFKGSYFGAGGKGSPGSRSRTKGPTVRKPESPAERPLRVVVTQGEKYFIDGAEVTLETVIERAGAVPTGTGPALHATFKSDARVDARDALKERLEALKISYHFENDF